MRLWPLLLLALAAPALATRLPVGVTVNKCRNYSSAAIEAIVSGDDDTSAVATVFQGVYGNSQQAGMKMVRRVGTHIYEGRILWMTPGQTVAFHVEVTDTAIARIRSADDTVSCTGLPQMVATGTVLYVAKSGSDANPGTLASPKLTINGALTAMRALSDSGARGGIIVAPGEYHERVDLNFGTDGQPRFISGDGANRDSTILCGAEPNLEAATPKFGTGALTTLSWAVRPTLGKVTDSVWVASLGAQKDAGDFPADSITGVILGWGEKLTRKTSLAAMQNDSTPPQGCSSCANQGEASGWFILENTAGKTDSLFVKSRVNTNPSTAILHLSYLPQLVTVWRPNWRVANLTLRYAGGPPQQTAPDTAAGWPNPVLFGYGVLARMSTNGGNGNKLVLDSLSVYGCNQRGIAIGEAFGTPHYRADSVTVAYCALDGLRQGDWGYSACKSKPEENADQIDYTGAYGSIVNNTVTNSFNGVGASAGQGSGDTLGCRFSEISGNTMSRMVDDGFELDGGADLNTLLLNNTANNSGSGLSMCAITWGGPLFAFYNTFFNTKFRGIKACLRTVGLVKFYQNTVVSGQSSPAFDASPGDSVSGLECLNNIFANRQGAAYYDPTSLSYLGLNSFDYNLWDNAWAPMWNRGGQLLARLDAATAVISSLGAHNISGKALFTDSTTLAPSAASPARWAGVSIPGVNDGLQGKLYSLTPWIGSKRGVEP